MAAAEPAEGAAGALGHVQRRADHVASQLLPSPGWHPVLRVTGQRAVRHR